MKEDKKIVKFNQEVSELKSSELLRFEPCSKTITLEELAEIWSNKFNFKDSKP